MGVDLEIWPIWSNGAHCHPSPSCSPPESDSLSPNGARTTWRLCLYESIFYFTSQAITGKVFPLSFKAIKENMSWALQEVELSKRYINLNPVFLWER